MGHDTGKNVTPKVLKTGSTPVVWKDDENPLTAMMSRVAFAALTCGFDLVSDKGFHHVVDDEASTQEELDASRSVTWLWDGSIHATFEPIERETIDLQEFDRRFRDMDWVLRNPHHPISHMRMFLEKSRDGFAKVAAIRPSRRVYRGDAVATVAHDATDEEIDEIFAQLNE